LWVYCIGPFTYALALPLVVVTVSSVKVSRLVLSVLISPDVQVRETLMFRGTPNVKIPAPVVFMVRRAMTGRRRAEPLKVRAVEPLMTTTPAPPPKVIAEAVPVVEILPAKELIPL